MYVLMLVFLCSGAMAQAPYCTPTYSSGCTYGDGLTSFQLGSISQTVACDGSPNTWYHSFTATTNVTIGSGSISVVAGYSSTYVTVWVDFNNNNGFETNEIIVNGFACAASGTTYTTPIVFPAGTTTGMHKLRFRTNWLSAATDPCATYSYGNAGDFNVTFVAPPPPGVAGLGSPANNATGVPITTPLVWTAPTTGGAPTGYKLYVGTDNPPTNLINGTNVGHVLTYSPVFAYLTHYNWKVVPTNLGGDATGAPVWGFTTVAPGSIAGIVTDGVTLTGIPGAMVTCGAYSSMTNDDGAYSVFGLAGPNTVVFTKTGYQTVTVTGVVVTVGGTTALNAQMFEEVYAPSCATAVVNADDTQSTVTWCVPNGPYELLYDDGSAENFAAWQLPGNMNAVKYTPKGYPAKVVGGKFFVGDGSFPVGGNFMGKKFRVDVYKADGTNGMPGTFVDSASVTVNSYGWINAAIPNAHEIASGSFYLVMVQLSAEPNCVPIGVDESLPKAYKSYSRNVVAGTPWVLSPYQDFMMHAVVSSPMADDDNAVSGNFVSPSRVQGMISQSSPMADAGIEMDATVTAPEGYDNYDMVSKYSLSRIYLGAVTPVPPASGVFTLLNNSITALTYTESGTTWSSLPQGWYAYCVKAVYPNGQESVCKYTNVIPHKMFADVTVNVQLVCGFVPAVGAVVTLTGADYPNSVLSMIVPASGTAFFDNVLKGNYQLKITKSGYTDYIMNLVITGNKTIDAVLEDLRHMPRNLFVDDMTLVATWDAPMAIAVNENFEGATFPPAGWLKTSSGTGWFASTNGGSSAFAIPAHTKYAVANDDASSTNVGCCDYLITPSLNLTNAPSYILSFQSYFSGTWGQSATVEMSTNGGTTWTVINTLAGTAAWKQIDIDLSAYSGPAGLAAVKFAFHSNDNGGWGSGWAIDDVSVASGGIPVLGYGVFLDATEVGQTPLRTWTFNPSNINYGQTYVAGVAALFCSGYSAKNTYTFTSHFLYPPVNLTATANTSNTSGAVILAWQAPVAGDAMVAGTPDYSWMQSSGTLSASGNTNNVSPGNGFTAVIDAPAAETELKYCGAQFDAIGAGAGTFMAAIRFTSTELYSYYGAKQITKAKIWLYSSGTNWTNVTMKVWKGGSMGNPGTEVYSQDVTSQIVPDAFTTVTLTTPVPLVAGNEYWVGYSVTATVGYPMACDAGPAVAGKGDWIYYAGAWSELAGFGLNYNWEITCIINDAGPQPGQNLVGYKIYRDDALLLQVPKTPLTYWDLNLLPATYCYDITAVYDLSVYGPAYAGLFGQSVKEGTACADVSYGYDLPFMETFTSGQFDINQWGVGPNWIMDGQAGNAQPSAKFKWDPLLSAYSSSLTSFYINAKAIDLGTPHKIWLDFDL
jgi:hypothetical protein